MDLSDTHPARPHNGRQDKVFRHGQRREDAAFLRNETKAKARNSVSRCGQQVVTI